MLNKRLMRMAGSSLRAVWGNVGVQWLGLCCNIATILSIGWLLGSLVEGSYTGQTLLVALLVAAGCTALRFGCALAASRLGHAASGNAKRVLRPLIYQKLLRLGPAYSAQVSTSEAVQVAVEGVDQLETFFGKYLPQLFYSLLAPLTLFVVMAQISLRAAVLLLVCVPLIPVSIMLVQKFAKKLLARYWGKYTALGDSFLENLQGLTTLKIYGSDEAKNDEMNARAEDFRRATMRVLVMQLNSITLMDLIAYGGAALGIVVAVSQYLGGRVDFAGCFCILLLAADFFLPLRMLGSFFHIAMNGMAAGDKIVKLLDLPEPDYGDAAPTEGDSRLALREVCYSYDGVRTVVQGVTLEAGPGITALVGESGCGKSTLAALLTGRARGYAGSITLGGAELSALSPEALSKTVTLVSHDSYLFKGTVRENLGMANPDATEDQMWAALEKVQLGAFLMGEQGLDTPLSERAANLSGGQRQRLALARALLHDTPVYIFDEATSNIDAESENDITAVIWEMGKTKTVLIISHRLATVAPAARIYVLRGGRVAEAGRHEELLAQNGLYATLFTTQQALEQVGRKGQSHAG